MIDLGLVPDFLAEDFIQKRITYPEFLKRANELTEKISRQKNMNCLNKPSQYK
jgi:hypothetical protein